VAVAPKPNVQLLESQGAQSIAKLISALLNLFYLRS